MHLIAIFGYARAFKVTAMMREKEEEEEEEEERRACGGVRGEKRRKHVEECRKY